MTPTYWQATKGPNLGMKKKKKKKKKWGRGGGGREEEGEEGDGERERGPRGPRLGPSASQFPLYLSIVFARVSAIGTASKQRPGCPRSHLGRERQLRPLCARTPGKTTALGQGALGGPREQRAEVSAALQSLTLTASSEQGGEFLPNPAHNMLPLTPPPSSPSPVHHPVRDRGSSPFIHPALPAEPPWLLRPLYRLGFEPQAFLFDARVRERSLEKQTFRPSGRYSGKFEEMLKQCLTLGTQYMWCFPGSFVLSLWRCEC